MINPIMLVSTMPKSMTHTAVGWTFDITDVQSDRELFSAMAEYSVMCSYLAGSQYMLSVMCSYLAGSQYMLSVLTAILGFATA